MADAYGGRHVADTWVPVERRWLGLDRRSLLPGLVTLALGALLSWGLPLIDAAVPGDDVVRAGDRLNLTDGLTVTPPTGWQILDGIRVGAGTTIPGEGSPTAAVAQDGIAAQIRVAPFSGDAGALLRQVNTNEQESPNRPEFTVDGDRTTVPAAGGIVGQAENYSSTTGDGILAAYTFPGGRGMTIQVDAASAKQLAAHSAAVDAMLRSVSLQEQP